jgi:hypothetical protein
MNGAKNTQGPRWYPAPEFSKTLEAARLAKQFRAEAKQQPRGSAAERYKVKTAIGYESIVRRHAYECESEMRRAASAKALGEQQ